jgi:hypothetical protein
VGDVDHDQDVPLVDDAPVPTLLDVETVTVVRGGPPPARLRWLAAFSMLIALTGGIVVVARHEPSADPDAALTKAQAAVADAASFRFEMRTTSHTTTGDPDGAGSDTTSRTVTTGDVAAKDRWRVIEQDSYSDGTSPYETRRIGDEMYLSGGEEPTDVGVGPAWDAGTVGTHEPTAADYADEYEMYSDESDPAYADEDPEYLLDALLSSYLLPVGDDPAHVERLVRDASQPAVEEHLADGGLRLRTQLDPIPAFVKVVDQPLPPVDLTIDLDPAGLPTAVRFSVAVKGASESVDVTFRDWGHSISVVAPAAADVDTTPWIEEERLAAVDPTLLLAPASVPGDLDLVSAYTYTYEDEGDAPEGADCHEVDLSYSNQTTNPFVGQDPADVDPEAMSDYLDSLPWLDITISPSVCDFDDTPFDQQLAGHAARTMGDGYVEVQIGDLTVAVSSQLSDDDLASLVASLRPTTVDQLAAQIPEWARAEAGMWFSDFTMGPGVVTTDSAEASSIAS